MRALGLFLTIIGGIVFALFIIAVTIQRFANPEWTETELFLWSLGRWWSWGPALILMGLGIWTLSKDKS